MPPDSFHYTHRVTYAECTLGDHIYYARYLEILEAARGELFRTLGRPLRQLQEEGILFPVLECHLKYLSPARYDDVLDAGLWLRRLDRLRVVFAYHLVDLDGNSVLDAETHHVCTTLEEKPKRMPADLMAQLQRFWRADDEPGPGEERCGS